jgi:hypothetical protein
MGEKDQLVARGTADASDPNALEQIAAQLGAGPFALVLLFVSPIADLPRVAAGAAKAVPAGHVLGCTTAGEISEAGYDEGTIVALGLPASHFAAETLVVPDLGRIAARDLEAELVRARTRLSHDHAHLPEEFALLLVDGLSMKEDELTAALVAGTGPIPLVGGSAGDGTRYHEAFVFDGPHLRRNAAVLAVVRSACPLRTFSVDHLIPTERRMVVTDADPGARTVRRINAEPAASEYARLLGRDPAGLDAFTFAAHPIAVRMGARHHVRAIQQIMPSGDLVFYSAIDEGVVLTITEPQDLAAHLETELARLSEPARPATILAFDCILRRIEAQEKQMTGRVSQLLRQHNVVGFSTYGEQTGPMHVNQTLTGLAFYPPGTVLPETEP